MDEHIKPLYQTIGEISARLQCGDRRTKKLIDAGMPVALVAGQYMITEKRLLEWADSLANKIKSIA